MKGEIDHLIELDVNGRITLKWLGVEWTRILGQGPVAGCY